jgi:hypothetical protein
MNTPIKTDNNVAVQVSTQLALIAGTALLLMVAACFDNNPTRYSVVEYNNVKEVKREYTTLQLPNRHGDFLVFEDSATKFLVRVRFAQAVVSKR